MRSLFRYSLALMLLATSATSARAETVAFAVVSGSEAHDLRPLVAKAARKKGRTVRDTTPLYEAIRTPLEAGACDAPAPGGLSKQMKVDWKAGTAVCRARASQTPYGPRNPDTFLTGRYLARVLWQRFIAEVNPRPMLEVWATQKKDGTWTLGVIAFEATDEKARRIEKENVFPTERDAVLAEIVRAALAGEGASVRRWLTLELPLAPAADPILMEGAVQYAEPLEVPAGCGEKLPARLVVEPASSPLAESIDKSWESTVLKLKRDGQAAGQGEWKCTTMAYMLVSNDFGSIQEVSRIWLRCGEQVWRAGRVEFSATPAKVRLKNTRDLLGKMVKGLCADKKEKDEASRSGRTGRRRIPRLPAPPR